MAASFNMTILIPTIIGLLLLTAIIVTALIKQKKKDSTQQQSASEPLPGGGGSYTMRIAGMNCEHCRANAEAALNAFAGVHAQVDLKSETAHIKYDGYPDLGLLDRLQKAVEDAGFQVTEIQ